MDFKDYRAQQTAREGIHRLRDGKIVIRDASKIDTLLVHQTACVFGPLADAAARFKRAFRIRAHLVTFLEKPGPCTVMANPMRAYVNHGGPFNARSLGWEIEAVHAGLIDDPSTPVREDLSTLWGDTSDRTVWTPEKAQACKDSLDIFLSAVKAEGITLKYVAAHRQGEDSRRSDPGDQIWSDVVLPHAVAVHGLITRPTWVLGDGRQIPHQWDPAASGAY